jgi:predicted transposase/invertase (TIGR01784 family)
LAVDDNGIKYDIEMQCRKTKDISARAIYYASKLFTKDLKENDDYNKSRVISIWIFAENVTDRKSAINEAFMTFQHNEIDNYEIMTDGLRIIYLELKKYLINSYNYYDKLTKWVDFLTNPIDLEKKTFEDEDIEKARKTLNYISSNKEERLIIEKIVEGRNDYYSAKNIAREEGREEGLKEGLKEGKIEGLKEGKIEIAKNMLKLNIDIKIILQSTGLTVDEINDLKE